MKYKWTALLLSGLLLGACSLENEADQSSSTFENRVSSDSSVIGEETPKDNGSTEMVDQHIAETEEETGLHVVDNPESIQVYVNKQRKLPDGYEPPDLVVPDVKHRYEAGHMETHMRMEASKALESLFSAAQAEKKDLMAISGYRSFERQTAIYNNLVNTQGKEYADKYSAYPGTSEHQTGLSIDVRYADDSSESKLDESFGETETGKWLAKHAYEYGFIIRYPKGKEEVTGYSYEPWHIRYVGKQVAKEIVQNDSTLEEYFGFDYPITE